MAEHGAFVVLPGPDAVCLAEASEEQPLLEKTSFASKIALHRLIPRAYAQFQMIGLFHLTKAAVYTSVLSLKSAQITQLATRRQAEAEGS